VDFAWVRQDIERSGFRIQEQTNIGFLAPRSQYSASGSVGLHEPTTCT
jgi:hypothetical protein